MILDTTTIVVLLGALSMLASAVSVYLVSWRWWCVAAMLVSVEALAIVRLA